MTAIVLPDIDKSTVEELMKRIPDVREIDLSSLKKLDLKKLDVPRLENAGKSDKPFDESEYRIKYKEPHEQNSGDWENR